NAKKASLQAWNYINTHVQWPAEGSVYHNPSVAGGCGEYSVKSMKPAKLWAAAELYRLTGDNTYQTAFESTFHSIQNPQVSNMYPTDEGNASWAMLMSHYANRDPYLTQLARKMVMLAADSMWDRMNTHPFYSTKHPAIVFTGWHSFSASAISATKLLKGYYITHDLKYRDAAWTTPNIEFGTNPQNRSYLVGVGYNPPLHPLDSSFTDPYAAVIRGGLVPGVTYHLPAFRQPYIAVNNAYYPQESTVSSTPWISNDWFASYPVLRRYTDAWSLIPMAESTVKEETWNAVSFALMRNENLSTQTSAQAYSWIAKQGYIGIKFEHIPLPDVPLLSPARITAFGTTVVESTVPVAWINALTPEQVGYIQATYIPHWVGKLSPVQKRGLTPAQIAGFTHATLFLELLPEQVPLIPAAKFSSTIRSMLPSTNALWMQQLTLPQLQVIQSLPYLSSRWSINLTATQKALLAGSLVDTQAPVISINPQNLTITTQDSYGISIQHPAIQSWLNTVTATDNVGTVGVLHHNAPYIFAVGNPISVIFSVTDAAGNTATKIGTIQIISDQSAPIITVPTSMTVAAVDTYGIASSDPLLLAFLQAATVSDNVDRGLSISNNTPTQLPIGTTSINFSSRDSAGNRSSKYSYITVTYPLKSVKFSDAKMTTQVMLSISSGTLDQYSLSLTTQAPVNHQVFNNALIHYAIRTPSIGSSSHITLVFNQTVPSNASLYKMNANGNLFLIPSTNWNLDASGNIHITLIDGGIYDLDGLANGSISNSMMVVTPVLSSTNNPLLPPLYSVSPVVNSSIASQPSKASGGCTIASQQGFDPVLLLLFVFSFLYSKRLSNNRKGGIE
ncbi:MAG: glycoside hydrolase family 9 protein, partial [Mariprofundaceae bacterium]|nr:glycoside hydrolase family 9 protein [Mariprofundaceae bacterium]